MRFMLVAILFLLVPAMARADVVIEDVLARQQGDRTNVRVTVHNPGEHGQSGPIVIELFARANEDEAWQTVKIWKDVRFLQKGYRVSRDIFDENSDLLSRLAAQGRFQVKATVTAPGLAATDEEVSWSRTPTQSDY